jgi:DNA ligase (NAD+)
MSEIEFINTYPNEYIDKTSNSKIETFLKKCSHHYYNSGLLLIEDDIYDILIDEYKEKNPSSNIFNLIGAPITERSEIVKVKLPYWLGSLDKIKPDTRELDNFFKKFSKPYLVSEKLDGLSALLHIENKQYKLYTRGNGSEGQDISYLIPLMNMNLKIEEDIAVRGELIMKENVFREKYVHLYPKSRSLIAGNVNAKKPNLDIIKDIDFVVYEVMDKISVESQFKKIKELGLLFPQYKIFNKDLSSEFLIKLYKEFKSNSQYMIDGIILSNCKEVYDINKKGNPKHKVAFKTRLDEQIAVTTIEDIEWNVSKRGVLVPRIRLKPIKIGGDTIKYTTGFNAKYVKENNLNIGSRLKIIRSGDVIPYILEIMKHSDKPLLPKVKYTWDKNGVNIVIDEKDNKDMIIQKLINTFSVLKIKYVSEGIVKKFVENKLNNLSKIYYLKKEDYLKLPSFREKISAKIFTEIHRVLDNPIDLHILMASSNCFDGLAEKKLKVIVDFYPKIMDTDLDLKDIKKCEGYSDKTSSVFIKGFIKFKKYLKENKFLKYKIKKVSKKKKNYKFENKNVVFTGFRDKQLEELIENSGGKVQSQINSKTDILIVKEMNNTSSKIKKAKELNIQIILL